MSEHFYVAISRPEDIIPQLGKGILHWRAGRSAKELAEAWWKARGIPNRVRSLLDTAEEWAGSEFLDGFFERSWYAGQAEPNGFADPFQGTTRKRNNRSRG